MKGSTVVAIVVLVLVVLAGGSLTVGLQDALKSRVSDYNNEAAQGAPQQTVVGTWSTREAVLSVGSVIAWSSVFLAVCICASVIVLLLRFDALLKSMALLMTASTSTSPAVFAGATSPVVSGTAPNTRIQQNHFTGD